MPRPVPNYEPPDPRQTRFQFGVLTILILMTAVAALVALLRPIPLPPAWRPYYLGAAIVWATYLVLRTAVILRRMFKQQRLLRSHREDLLRWADEVRRESPKSGGDEQTNLET